MKTTRSIDAPLVFLLGWLMLTGCSNVVRSGLVNDRSILLPPSVARTIYIQIRNTSENQLVTPTAIPARLTAKGYQIVQDPSSAAYWLQTQIVYCHKAGDGVRPEAVAKAGFGAGIGSGGAPLAGTGGLDQDLTGALFAGMPGSDMNAQALRAMAVGTGGTPDLNALMRMAARAQGGYPGMAPPPSSEGSLYLCVADVLVTDRGNAEQPRTFTMRSVAHVLQKTLKIEEATPILRDKFVASMTGAF